MKHEGTNLDDNEINDRDDDDRKLFDPTKAIKITTGVGKSDVIRRMIANYYIRRAKRMSLPHRVLYLVANTQTRRRGAHQDARRRNYCRLAGPRRHQARYRRKMCLNPEAVKAAIKIGANIEKTACKSKKARCPFYESCHYQAQKPRRLSRHGVRGARDSVPGANGDRQDFGLVVIDEAFWQDGLAAKSRLVIDSLADELKEFPVRDHNGSRLDLDTKPSRPDRAVAIRAGAMPDGYVRAGS